MDDDNPTKVILITSKSLPIVKAKLTVYKKYKHVINERKIFLHHEYEEFDDVAKMVAYQKVVAFCSFVESLINSFSVDFYKIITDYVGKSLTAELIEKMCLKAFYEIQDGMHFKRYESRFTGMLNKFKITEDLDLAIFETKRILRTCMGRPKRDWRKWIAIKIHQKFSQKGEIKCTDARSAIWNVCQKTVDDLGIILSGLEEFHTRVLPVDHKKRKATIYHYYFHLLNICIVRSIRKRNTDLEFPCYVEFMTLLLTKMLLIFAVPRQRMGCIVFTPSFPYMCFCSIS